MEQQRASSDHHDGGRWHLPGQETCRRRQAALGGVMAACLGTALLSTAPAGHPARASLLPSPSPAATVTAFTQTTLTPRVLLLEDAVTTASWAVQAYDAGSRGGIFLASVLTEQEQLLRSSAAALTTLFPPVIGLLPTLQMTCVLEDLALFGEQLARLLHDVIAALALSSPPAAPPEVPVEGVSYPARARAAVALLQRAEGWLETIDHETGAHARLPGFEPGRPLEHRLHLQ